MTSSQQLKLPTEGNCSLCSRGAQTPKKLNNDDENHSCFLPCDISLMSGGLNIREIATLLMLISYCLQLMMRSRSSPEESELESRLHQLTETLLQKQTIVETMTAEKSSLVLQLERAEVT